MTSRSSKWRAFPTWILVRSTSQFLPENHPWKGRAFTLREWADGQTEKCRMFDACFWAVGVLWTVIILQLAGVLR